MDEYEIFAEALSHTSPEERAAYLERACAGDDALRSRIEALLAEHEKLGSFLESPPPGLAAADRPSPPTAEETETQIGPYKLLQPIGEGGMGTVYLAEQQEPVKRRVALKIIKPGMDSQQVIKRFEAERQALALMDHPSIARILDAGTTSSGRPYFVMELVKGVPITQYCDEHRLTPHERLKLFIPVCDAVQHAHQKGVIHRDLKPSNIMVADDGGTPVPKIIDFGVARAINQTLTERTFFTQLGQVVGTVEYMSPEQADLNQRDVDTRSDVYSLGVLLYELLTGTTPFERGRLRQAALDELLRIIREEEPPKPSMRLSTAEGLPSIAANRKTEPRKLSGLIRGELDWIVLKALNKERSRRYETVNGLAKDIQRFLNHEPVVAGPPAAAYRLRKFIRRNRGAVVAASLVLFALVAGGIAATLGFLEARRQARIARAESAERESARADEALHRQAAEKAAERARRFSDFVLGELGETDPFAKYFPLYTRRAGGPPRAARGVVASAEFLDRVKEHADLHLAAYPHDRAKVLLVLANAMRAASHFDAARRTLDDARQAFDAALETTAEDRGRWRFSLGCFFHEIGQLERADEVLIEIVNDPATPLTPVELADTHFRLAWLCGDRSVLPGHGTFDSRQQLMARVRSHAATAIELYRRADVPDAKMRIAICELVALLNGQQNLYAGLLQIAKALGSIPQSDRIIRGLLLFGEAEELRMRGKIDEAVERLKEADQLAISTFGPESFHRAIAFGSLTALEFRAVKESPDPARREAHAKAAETHCLELLALGRRIAPRHARLAQGLFTLGTFYYERQRFAEARKLFDEALPIVRLHPVDMRGVEEKIEQLRKSMPNSP